jgi:hypothetical protein
MRYVPRSAAGPVTAPDSVAPGNLSPSLLEKTILLQRHWPKVYCKLSTKFSVRHQPLLTCDSLHTRKFGTARAFADLRFVESCVRARHYAVSQAGSSPGPVQSVLST